MDGSTITHEVTQTDVIKAVRESALLADITISVWNAERSDKTLLEQVKQTHNATGDVGRVMKNMMAGADTKLKDVRSAFAACRSLHYSYTLPWVADPHAERSRGPRLLPHLLFETYLTALSKQKRVANSALEDFLVEYPALSAQARANLGGMADAVYPTVDEVRALFKVSFDFEPIPAGAAFNGLPEHFLERLSKGLQGKQERMIASATAAMWAEAKERVGHALEKLSDPEARFKSSTIESVRELITLLPGWNMVGNPQVDEVVADIRQMIDNVDAEKIRKDTTARADVSNQAKRVMDKLGSWGV